MLHLRDLAILAAVVEEDGIHGAAQKLHKTPPSISQTIRRLEDTLSLQLFDRSQYRLRLTDHGQAFLEQSRLLLGRADALERYARLLAGGQERTLKVSVHPIVHEAVYLRRISMVVDAFRETSLQILLDTAAGPLLRLQNGHVDLCIAASNHVGSAYLNGTESILLGSVQTAVVVHPAMLTGSARSEDIAERLRGTRQIVVGGSVEGDAGERAVFEEQPPWLVGCPDTKRRLVLQGMGWGRLPLPLIEHDLNDGRLVSVAIPGVLEPEEFTVWAFRRANQTVGPVADAVWRGLSGEGLVPRLQQISQTTAPELSFN